MSTQIRLTYFGMEGTGRTVTEAKKDAGRKIEKALEGYYTPIIITHRGYAALVARHPVHGWGHCLIAYPDGRIKDGSIHCNGTYEKERDAVQHACDHLADLGMKVDDTDPPDILKTDAQRAEWRHKLEWRKRWEKARAAGLDSNDAHAWASGCIGRPDLVHAVPA